MYVNMRSCYERGLRQILNQNKSNNPKGKQQDKSLPSEGGGEKEGSVSVVTQNANNSTNKVQVQNPTPVQNQNPGVDTYQNPGYGYGYGYGDEYGLNDDEEYGDEEEEETYMRAA